MTNKRDEINAARKKKRRKYRVKRLLTLFLVVAVAFAGLLVVNTLTPTTVKDISNYFGTAFELKNRFPAELSNALPIEAKQLSRGYAVLTSSEVITLGKSGKAHYTFKHGFSSPSIAAGNSRVLLYNRGNRDVVVFNQSEELARWNTEQQIVSADISASGAVAVLTESDLYTAELAVYDRASYQLSFTWYQASGFPLSVTLSDNGKMAAVVSLGTGPNGLVSAVTLIDVNKMQEIGVIEVDALVLRVLLDEPNVVAIITDQGAQCRALDGALLAEYEFPDMPLLTAEYDARGLVLAFGDNSRSDVNKLVCLNRDMETLFEIENVGAVSGLYKSRDRIFVLGDKEVAAYNMKGELVARYEAEKRAIDVFARGGGVYIVYPDHMQQSDRIEEATS